MYTRLRFLVALFTLSLIPPLAQTKLHASTVTNLSTRVKIETGGGVGIAGFIVQGTGVKPVLIRALGPTLGTLGVPNVLADPSIEIYDAGGTKFGSNDNWDQSTGDIQVKHAMLGISLPQAKESVVYTVLPPGAYTAIVRGVGNATGVALVEIYDLDTAAACTLTNVSTRGMVGTGAEVMIGGFIIGGTGTKDILVRAIGPTLTQFGLTGVLVDPTIDVYNTAGTKIYSNNDWSNQTAPATQAAIVATGKAPPDSHESALLMTLNPGAYTVLLSGVSSGTGIALVEVYDVAATTTQPVNGQLYLATLRPDSGAVTIGSGDISMTVAADGQSATISSPYYSALSGNITNMQVEDRNGNILFDLAKFNMHADGTWTWTFSKTNGSLTVAQVVSMISSGQVVVVIYTDTNPGGELSGTFGAASGSASFSPPSAPPALPGGAPTAADASRFLTQATFGPTSITSTTDRTSIAYVQNRGLSAWIDEQFAMPASNVMPLIPAPTADTNTPPNAQVPSLNYTYWSWWQRSITAPDQLRQRVAYALSQVLVVSTNSSNLDDEPYGVSAYYDILVNDAFGNFRTLLKDVTLNPGMGEFLDMLKNRKATSSTNPNENYAREVMQLFSIGLYQLYPDGTLQLDSRGLPVPTYDQTQITGLARVLTGWSYADAGTNFNANRVFKIGIIPVSYTQPMIVFPAQHEPGAKVLLNGAAIGVKTSTDNNVANINAELSYALSTIFDHPNVGPFISRQLIQRLVTSNPSPGYIYRVSRKFDDNGSGVRGDLKAVIKSILLDYEARTIDTLNFPGAGKQQEPVLRLAKVIRAFNGKSVNATWRFTGIAGQTPLNAPTVFNFYSPDYIAPGVIANANLRSPEFDVTNESTIIQSENIMRSLAFSGGIGGGGNDQTKLNFITDDTDPLLPLAANDPGGLMDKLNLLLMSNQMSSDTYLAVYGAIVTVVPQSSVNTGTAAQKLANQRARLSTAVHLISTSPQFSTQR